METDVYNSVEEWKAEGERIFGSDNPGTWMTECPACGRVQTQKEFKQYKDKGATPESFVQECLGRYTGGRKGPHKCDWAAYGLFRGPVLIKHKDGETAAFRFIKQEDTE